MFLHGSSVTGKEMPCYYDACWAVDSVNEDNLDPVFLDFDDHRARQKARPWVSTFPRTSLKESVGRRS